MAYGNNKAAPMPKASFQEAGGTTFLYRHPFLTGMLSKSSAIDELDVSKSLQLNANFFQANPSQDSSLQERLVDGSTITITNHSLAGTMTLQALSTTGFVGTGDFIACAHLIVASGDSVGGTLTVIRSFGGKRRIRLYYGVSFKNVPHELIAGNAIVPYPVVMEYSGWVEMLGASSVARKTIWAVGNKYSLDAVFIPYDYTSILTDGGSLPNYPGIAMADKNSSEIFGNTDGISGKEAATAAMAGIGSDKDDLKYETYP
jgi:hypothetical protein